MPACIPPIVRFLFAGRGISFFYSLTSAKCTEPCILSPHRKLHEHKGTVCPRAPANSWIAHPLWIPVSIQQHCDMLLYGDTNTLPKPSWLQPRLQPSSKGSCHPCCGQCLFSPCSELPATLPLQADAQRPLRSRRVSKTTTKDPFQLKYFFRKCAGLGDLSPTAGQFSLMLWTVCTYQPQTVSSILFSSAPFCHFPVLCLGLASAY